MLTIQNYVRPQSLQEAWELNQKSSSRIAGGMLWMKMSKGNCGTLIDLSDLGLNTIVETEKEISIGAMVTLREIELHPSLQSYSWGAVQRALKNIVGVQFRNLATLGGSLWGRFGFSDVLTVFLAMDAYVELYKGGIIPLSEFAKMNYDRDILVRLIIKKQPCLMAYEDMRIASTDIPVLTCAISYIDGIFRATVGARPGRAMLFYDEKGILSEWITEESAEAFSRYLMEQVPTSGNIRGSSAYRIQLVKVLSRRALLQIKGGN